VAGAATEASACAANELPQCIQKAVLAFTVPEQCGQVVVAASAACTGVPQSGQNFLPLTSRPQFVQGVMANSLSDGAREERRSIHWIVNKFRIYLSLLQVVYF
jgi:hypothetical protein